MVTTQVTGIRYFVDGKDIVMMHSVVDVSGLNRILRQILNNAAGAIVGMINAPKLPNWQLKGDKKTIAITSLGITSPCATKAKNILEKLGYEVVIFHATGAGGEAMEKLIGEGIIKGVLDLTTHELADELIGEESSAGPHRLEAAGKVGIPQVICPGGIDTIVFKNSVPEKFKNRRIFQERSKLFCMRTNKEENAEIGKIMANKANRSTGPTTLLIPLRGFSALDKENGPFWDPEADKSFIEALKDNLNKRVKVVEIDTHINDAEFAKTAVEILHKMMIEKYGG